MLITDPGTDEDEQEGDGEASSEGDNLSTAGGLDELLNRANIELGGAVRTDSAATTTGKHLTAKRPLST
jgi:hypothetical protein